MPLACSLSSFPSAERQKATPILDENGLEEVWIFLILIPLVHPLLRFPLRFLTLLLLIRFRSLHPPLLRAPPLAILPHLLPLPKPLLVRRGARVGAHSFDNFYLCDL